MRREPKELLDLRNTLSNINNHKTSVLKSRYDLGSMPPCKESPVINEIETGKMYKWWIGLSLGAAVAYVSACAVSLNKRPSRLTLINTFHNRLELSKEMKFSIDNQWPLIPQDFTLDHNIQIDLVISDEDKKIPSKYGLMMLNQMSNNNVNIIKIKSDHQISSPVYQVKLAEVLLSIFYPLKHYYKQPHQKTHIIS